MTAPALRHLDSDITCDYCAGPLPTGGRHEMCDLETSTEPLLAPLHSCPDSGTYPCDICTPMEVPA